MSAESVRGSKRHRVIVGIIAALVFGACGHDSEAQPPRKTPPPRGDASGVFEPTPGREADFFRAVEVFIKVDFEKPSIAIEPFDPFCPSEDAARAGKCNVVTIDVPVRPHGRGMQASHEDTMAFLEDLEQREAATRTVHLPRIFYPPDSTGKGSSQTSSGCRPAEPARQYRWSVQCADGSSDCMGPRDQVIIRPKVSSQLSDCKVRIENHEPNFVILDRLAAMLPQYNCARDFTAPRPPDGAPAMREGMDKAAEYMKSDRYQRYVANHNEHFKAKAELDRRQAKTLFSPQSSATFSITTACGPEGTCPGCCQGSVTSGIPNQPRFMKPGSGVMWDYGIELWRNGTCLAELDPPGWIEDDGDPGSG